eukprot:COSAG02_NODE_52178_length_309_cov_0.985714_1_plen_34_part_10
MRRRVREGDRLRLSAATEPHVLQHFGHAALPNQG